MEIEFVANKITYEVDAAEGSLMIGFSDNGDEPHEYVIIERAMEFDEQDVRLGMNTYYFEYSDQSNSGYGILKSVKLEERKVIFALKEKALDDISSIKITFDNDAMIPDRREFERVFYKIIME